MARTQADNSRKKSKNSGESPDFEALLYDVGQNRNKESFIALFQYFAPRIKSFLMTGGANEASADELAQETMLNVWNKAEGYDPAKSAASTWIYTIARNKRIDALRKNRGTHINFDSLPMIEDEETPSPARKTQIREEKTTLFTALKDLPEEQAGLIRKAFYEDKSHQDIAKETGLPLGTVKSRIRLGLERLRQQSKIQELWS